MSTVAASTARPVRTKPRREDLRPGEVLCQYCSAKCCRYFALAIDEPTEWRDFETLRWYLLHGDVAVFTEDGTWYLLVYNTCRHLQDDNRCGIYATRPPICREYTTDDCEYEDSWVYERYLETPEQVAEYAEAMMAGLGGPCERSPQPPLLPLL
jgi:Fe-S-cluster containining protein